MYKIDFIFLSNEIFSGILKILLKRNYDINKIQRGVNALFLACTKGNFEIIKILIKNKCKTNFKQDELIKPLACVIAENLKKDKKYKEILFNLIE